MSINKMEYCIGATSFIGASIFIMFKDPNTENDLKILLDDEQLKKLDNIKKERFSIWLKASLIGIIVSFTICHILEEDNNKLKKTCLCTLIFFIVQYLVYYLHPKEDYLLIHLKTKEQKIAWLENYRIIRLRWIFGLLFGLLGYFQITYFCYNNIN